MANSFLTEWKKDLGYVSLAGLHSDRGTDVVIALHGFLDNANSMANLAAAFTEHHYIAIDLAGHGHSGHRPPGVHYNQMDYLQDLYQLIEALNIDQVTLVGHSLGGILALNYAAVFPEQVKAIVSIDALGPLTMDEATTAPQLREAILSRSQKMHRPGSVHASLEKAVKARTLATDLSEQLCLKILERNFDTKGQQWRSDSRLRTKSLLRLTPLQAQHLMQNIQCPALIVGATNSFKSLSTVISQRQAWFDNMDFHLLTGGHHIHLEREDETLALIGQFISKL